MAAKETVVDARIARLERNTMFLFHQTDKATAKTIIESQRFKRGDPKALAGAGIYFAFSPKATYDKAARKGVILKAEVLLGRVKTIDAGKLRASPSERQLLTFTQLQREGFDSVKIRRRTGDEIVVYNWDQVRNIVAHTEAATGRPTSRAPSGPAPTGRAKKPTGSTSSRATVRPRSSLVAASPRKPKPDCKYGHACYRKHPGHLAKYRHPTRK